ncbi:hypothetical protein [Ruminococcus sp. HUN007]|uniref:hypothetical protein n=1 Tax=Ruminococcus sp. HUN007 TaxID=1514668 RepID=UPI000AB62D91|nr:hypothetical protein [Ruminococcus sp. HUN007]
MIFIPEIPNNKSTKYIEKFIENCKTLAVKDYDDDDNSFIFNQAATIEDINEWEKK